VTRDDATFKFFRILMIVYRRQNEETDLA